jgi:hypothetical protein
MVAAAKFDAFVEHLAEKVHNLGADSLRAMLVNSPAPTAANAVKAELTEIAAGNGYSAGGATLTIQTSAQSGGLYKLTVADAVVTASGAVGPFRYVVIYNDTPSSAPIDPLINFYDYGSSITLQVGETFTMDFDQVNGLLTLQ